MKFYQSIDLSGPKGNAFYLIGIAIDYMKKLKFSPEKTQKILDEM